MQNIYDDEEFFSAYSKFARHDHGLDSVAEWPTMRAMLGDLTGKDVLDLGCGFGAFCRYAAEAGARSVGGVDISEKMLERAMAETSAPNVAYKRDSIERFMASRGSFDVVFSSLAFHYVEDFTGICTRAAIMLREGGQFVFSVEHPIFTALAAQSWYGQNGARLHWPVDNYLTEGRRDTNWLQVGVAKYHRTIGTTVNTLIGAGFAIRELVEWGPSPEQVAAHPQWADDARRPIFLLVSAQK